MVQRAQGACCLFTLSLLQCMAFLVICCITLFALISWDPSIGYSWLCIWLLQGQLCVLYVCTFKLLNIWTIVATMIDAMILSILEGVVASALARADFPEECREKGCTSLSGTIYQRGSIAFGLLFLGVYHFFQAIGLISVVITIGRRLTRMPPRVIVVNPDEVRRSSKSRRSKSKSKSRSRSRSSHKKSKKSKSTKAQRARKARSAPCVSEASKESSTRSSKTKSRASSRKSSRPSTPPISIHKARSDVSINSALYTVPSTFNPQPSQISQSSQISEPFIPSIHRPAPIVSYPKSSSTTNGTTFYSDPLQKWCAPPSAQNSFVVTMPSHIPEGGISRIVIRIPPPFQSQSSNPNFIPESQTSLPRKDPIIITDRPKKYLSHHCEKLDNGTYSCLIGPPHIRCGWSTETLTSTSENSSKEKREKTKVKRQPSYSELRRHQPKPNPNPVHRKSSLYNFNSKRSDSPYDSTFNFDFDAVSDNKSIILPSSIGQSPGHNVVAAQSIFTANKPQEK
uniref:MARVEL domain-containing protein n=1 Tax=Panagrellus redivivus TaxID=6233 RepID=A0A7E4VFY9_PANRE